jgi:hypothetical protein
VFSVRDVVERFRKKSNMLQGFGDAVLRAEALEDQLLKSRKHATAMQSKLDVAFAKYHNDVQDMQAKSDDLVRRNKTLHNKNKGIPLDLLGSYWRSRGSLTRCALLCGRAWGPGGAVEVLRDKLLTQNVHPTPNTQQAEQSWLHTCKESQDVPVNFP